MRRASGKPYRFIRRKSRPIEVIFRHIPGKRFSSGTYDMSEAVLFAENFMENEGFARSSAPLLSSFAKDFFIRSDSGSHSHSVSETSKGSGNAHNNLPPYLAVYMWKRTA